MHTEKRIKKYSVLYRICSILMVIVLLVSLGMPVSAATAQATTMKLEKTEGTVTLKTQNGTKRKITNGMRLYNGNSVTTISDSYAYISLDSSKAVKLDEKSSATLRQSGKKLELLVKSGKLFFNVSSPLTDEESMNIRTSTMVTGVRGTCGVVEYVNSNVSKLYLVQGQVTLGKGENATIIRGGQSATVYMYPKEEGGEIGGTGESTGATDGTSDNMEQKVDVEELTEEEIPIFAITEILDDLKLQAKIEQTTNLSIEKMAEIYEKSQQKEDSEDKDLEEDPEEGDLQENSTDDTQQRLPFSPYPSGDDIIMDLGGGEEKPEQ